MKRQKFNEVVHADPTGVPEGRHFVGVNTIFYCVKKCLMRDRIKEFLYVNRKASHVLPIGSFIKNSKTTSELMTKRVYAIPVRTRGK